MLSYRRRSVAAVVVGGAVAFVISIALFASDASADRRPKRRPHTARDGGAASTNADARAPKPAATPPATGARAASGQGLVCYYGKATDGHSGRERCLAPEELDPPLHILVDTRALADELGMLHAPEPQSDAGANAADGGADDDDDAGDEGGVSGSYKARVVSVSFENGVAGRAHGSLKRISSKMAECVVTEGGLKVQSARLKLMFLVRARGRAEGLIVSSARNVPPKIVRCITKLIESQPLGTPSNDPVGVTALIELKEREP